MIRMFSRYIYYNIYQGSVNVNKHIHVYVDRDMLPSQHFNARRGIWIRPAVLSAQSETSLSYIVYSAYMLFVITVNGHPPFFCFLQRQVITERFK